MKFSAVIGSIVRNIQGTLPAGVDAGATTIDFGRAVVIGGLAYLCRDGVEEYVTVGNPVSETAYSVGRGANGSMPQNWAAGARFVSSSTMLKMQFDNFGLGSFDVTRSVKFSTQVHGGFAACTFLVPGRKYTTYSRLFSFLGSDVVIYDQYGRSVWEGYITNTDTDNRGGDVEVTCSGFYSRAKETYFDMIYMSPPESENLIPNPSFEHSTNALYGWGGSNITVTITGGGMYGNHCLVLSEYNPGGMRYWNSGTFQGNVSGLVNGQEYTLSFYAKGTEFASNAAPVVQVINGGSTTELATLTLSDLDDAWSRYELSSFKAANSYVTILITIGVADENEPSGVVYLDAFQLEKSAVATPYFDGSFGGKCYWTGTANESKSIRQASHVYQNQVITDAIHKMAGEGVPWNPNAGCARNTTNDGDFEIGPCDFTDKRVSDAIEYAMSFGTDYLGNACGTYFAIYSDGIPYVFVDYRPGTRWADWFVRVGNTQGTEATASVSVSDIYNRVFSVHSDSGNGPTKTEPSEDLLSQGRFGVREGMVQNSDLPYTQTHANFLQQYALSKYKDPRPVYTLEISSLVLRAIGQLDFPYMIRAGQTIVVTDIDPMAANTGSLAGQVGYRAVCFVMRTEYDAQSNTVRVDINSSDLSFETLMGRIGVSGGLA